MPELPEVETVRRGLAASVTGRTISAVTVAHPRAIRRHLAGATDFAARLAGRRIQRVCRRGKYLWLPVDGDDVLVAHLGMSGQLLVRFPEAADEGHLRVRFVFADAGTQLRFVDQRTFGSMAVEPAGADGLPPSIAHIAIDPLDPEFDDQAFYALLRRRRTGVKRALLDQTLVSGIGNIYADEALWRAQLHYAHPAETLTRQRAARLLGELRAVLTAALTSGGTSFDSVYVNVNGHSGYFDRSLEVYGRAGKPCRRCGTAILREAFTNRSSYRCPYCQPAGS